jgi:hypothetical protein
VQCRFRGFCFALSFISVDSLAARNPQLQV